MGDINEFPDFSLFQGLNRKPRGKNIESLRLWLSLMDASSKVHKYFDSFLDRHGLGRSRFFILLILLRHTKPVPVLEIAKILNVSAPTATGLIERMEKDGYVTKIRREDDARVREVAMTLKGEEVLARALPEHYRNITELMNSLTDSEKEMLETITAKLSDWFGN
jgi:DNA-binding MarR family transcriptional regulator